MTTRKIEVKNLKTLNIGHEGGAFTATLYVDGKRIGTVEDAGYGGGIDYRFDRKVLDELLAYAKSLPDHETEWGPVASHLDILVGTAVGEFETRRMLKRNCRTKTVIELPSEPDQYRTFNAKFSPKVKAYVLKKYPTAVFINETI